MKRNLTSFPAALSFACVFLAAASGTAEAIDGQALFAKHCTACHRNPAQLTLGNDLASLLRNPPGSMPLFPGEKISDESAAAIARFIASFSAPGPAVKNIQSPAEQVSGPPAARPVFDIVPEKPLSPVRIPRDQKDPMRGFVKKWVLIEKDSGAFVQKFEIAVNRNGDLTIIPSTTMNEKAMTISRFDIAGRTLHLQVKWKMSNARSYWKIETFELNLSEDGTALAGTCIVDTAGNKTVVRSVRSE